ncbi:MAG: flagellar basal body-associated FliL family protein [Zoogloeaceae bacterium]|jgi:flagellar FliL protein|nr:flagellar basal body-associated FliL family protein [Zoogloeaceae bacterium]
MANKEAEAAPAQAAPKRNRKLVILVLALFVFLLLAAVGAGVFLFSHSGGDGEEEEDAPSAAAQDVKKPKKTTRELPPIFVNLDPITVNLRPDEGGDSQYLQTIISLEVEDIQADAQIKNMMPRIRNDVTMIMSDKQPSQLMDKNGKETMATEIKDAVNAIVGVPSKDKARPPEGPVNAVLFTTFIIQ